jgi:galactokinase
MYKYRKPNKSTLTSVECVEGEPIELKIERIVSNKEPITDGAPEIFTERKEGVKSAYNIRTDRWEVAAEAMSKVEGSIQAKRDAKAKKPEEKEAKVIDINVEVDKEVSVAKPTEGTAGK